ncbi:LOW QUALITY PROTEIN: uncharacterized protein LOC110807581, partial [Carica papaya]|uniref:LOW QUALITY PROTEIN: uncharacterized protein LOC110807581 n=1 Tax=Carica papaya TaxID=3649 RepID=UPI000B8CCD50
ISADSSICFLPHRGKKSGYTLFIRLLELFLMTYAFCYHFQLDDPLIQFEEEMNSFHFIFLRAVALNFFRGLEQMKPSFFFLGPLWLLILSSLFLASGLASSWSPCPFETLGPCPWVVDVVACSFL